MTAYRRAAQHGAGLTAGRPSRSAAAPWGLQFLTLSQVPGVLGRLLRGEAGQPDPAQRRRHGSAARPDPAPSSSQGSSERPVTSTALRQPAASFCRRPRSCWHPASSGRTVTADRSGTERTSRSCPRSLARDGPAGSPRPRRSLCGIQPGEVGAEHGQADLGDHPVLAERRQLQLEGMPEHPLWPLHPAGVLPPPAGRLGQLLQPVRFTKYLIWLISYVVRTSRTPGRSLQGAITPTGTSAGRAGRTRSSSRPGCRGIAAAGSCRRACPPSRSPRRRAGSRG